MNIIVLFDDWILPCVLREVSWFVPIVSYQRRSIVRILSISSLLTCVVLVAAALPVSKEAWKVTKTFQIGDQGSYWDYISVDPPNHRLFVTRGTHTIAVDEFSGHVLGNIPGQKHSHGVALVPKLGRGFITDGGGSGKIIVFDSKSYAVLGAIPAMPDADGIIYDAKLNRVLAVSGDGGKLMTFSPEIDTKTGKVETIDLGGSPEFLASDGSGKVYIDLEDKNVVAVVDLKTRKVVSRWPVAPGGHPVGLAMDPASHRLFIGCRNPQKLVIMNATTGAIEGALPIGSGVDATRFDSGRAFASTGDGAITVADEQGGKWVVEQTVKTANGARTMGVDERTHKIYLPTAELEPGRNGRPTPKPGTFMILEVSHSM